MSTEVFYFTGTVNYALVHKPDSKYGKYQMDFYPLDAAGRRAIKDTGIKNGVKEDQEGNFFYKFANEYKPSVVDKEGNPVTALVGNGSTVQIKLVVDTFNAKPSDDGKFPGGQTTRGVVEAVRILELVPYVAPEREVTPTDWPLVD